jgi:hypothetical protein
VERKGPHHPSIFYPQIPGRTKKRPANAGLFHEFIGSLFLYRLDLRRPDERVIRVLEDPDELRRGELADARLAADPVLRAGERLLPLLGRTTRVLLLERALLALLEVRADLPVDLDGDVLLVVLEGAMADDRDEDLRCSCPRELRVVLLRGAIRVVVRD